MLERNCLCAQSVTRYAQVRVKTTTVAQAQGTEIQHKLVPTYNKPYDRLLCITLGNPEKVQLLQYF